MKAQLIGYWQMVPRKLQYGWQVAGRQAGNQKGGGWVKEMPKQRIQVDLEFEQFMWIMEKVKQTGQSRNEVIRNLIQMCMEKEGK